MSDHATLYPRQIRARIDEAMADTPVVLISGPRQAGKTTLVKQMADRRMHYLTLDDELTLLAAKEDPVGLIREHDYLIVDEVQRAPELILAIKKAVDDDRRPGRFLLTGSANLMTLPTVADSLAGRMETLRLLPLSQSELHGGTANWIDTVSAGSVPKLGLPLTGSELTETVLRGGYPEALSRATVKRRTMWARQYINAIIQRDVRDVAGVEKLDRMPRLLRALAHASGQLSNYTQLGGKIGLDHKSVARYIGVLENMFLLARVSTFAVNRLKRVVKTPKIHFIDSGLLATLMDLTPENARENRDRFGTVLETFVYGELLKHVSSGEGDYELFYYRDHDKLEVDFVIENATGDTIGVEVKSTATIKADDLRGLHRFSEAVGPRFKKGIVLYDGTETVPLSKHIRAVPLSTLWGH